MKGTVTHERRVLLLSSRFLALPTHRPDSMGRIHDPFKRPSRGLAVHARAERRQAALSDHWSPRVQHGSAWRATPRVSLCDSDQILHKAVVP